MWVYLRLNTHITTQTSLTLMVTKNVSAVQVRIEKALKWPIMS